MTHGVAGGFFAIGLAAAPALAACPLPPETVTIAQARGDGTLDLSDGRTIMPAGAVLSETGRARLAEIIRGESIVIRPAGKPDRWGRQAAYIEGVEEDLLKRGLGHATALGPEACLAPLVAAERHARARNAGIWSRPDFVIDATDRPGLIERIGQHAVAEGRVVSARTVRGRVYLNFARYWKTGLSLIIAEKNWPMFAGGAEPESLVGRRLRVRGRIEHTVGPAILAGPDDRIEILGR